MKFHYQSNANLPGIYKILNTHTNRVYVGQCKLFKVRWNQHKLALIANRHQNKFLLNDFNKCFEELGHDDFLEFHVLEVIEGSTKEERNLKEEEWIAKFWDKQNSCYNFHQKVDGKEKSHYSSTPKETRKRKSEAAKGKPSPMKGKYHSEESKKNMSHAQQRMKISQFGVHHSLKTEFQQGRSHPQFEKRRTEEERHSISFSLKGSQNWNFGRTGSQHPKSKIYVVQLQAPDGTVVSKIEGLLEFCRIHNLKESCLRGVLSGKRKTHKGWHLL
jgi:group I intron endonuclease